MEKFQSTMEIVDHKIEAKSNQPEEDNHLDAIISRIGQFGRYQLTICSLLCVPVIFNAIFAISYVFTASSVAHRCHISQCDSGNSSYVAPWLNFTTPHSHGEWSQCEQFVSLGGEYCEPENFDRSQVVSCNTGYKLMGEERTIASEFGIFCSDEWKLTMVGTVNNIGQFVGIPLGGFLSDRYGRKFMLTVFGVLSAVAGIVQSFASNYYFFLCFEFLASSGGSALYSPAFLLAIELVGPKRRLVAATTILFTYELATAGLSYLARYLRDWQTLLRVLYTPALLHLLYICLLPESVRWLLSQSRELEAKQILRKIARVNRRELPESQLREMMYTNRQVLEAAKLDGGHYSAGQIVRALGWRIAQCCFVWFTNTLISLGLMLNIGTLSGNKYDNFSLIAITGIPGELLANLLMPCIGRRHASSLSLFTLSLCLLIAVVLGPTYSTVSTYLYFVAKIFSSSSFFILYFFTAEMFPTNCRNGLLSFCSMVGRIGSILAPMTPLLTKNYPFAPHVLFGTIAFLCAGLALFLPETTNKPLPTTLEEACALDRNMPKKSSKQAKTETMKV